ncbi:hypothetical protein Tco_0690657 [Tanacetum coccineum]
MGFTLILATLDGLDVGLLEDVIGKDDCDDDDCDEEMSLEEVTIEGLGSHLWKEMIKRLVIWCYDIEEDEVSLVDGVLEGANLEL